MAKYRKKAVVIEAIRWSGKNVQSLAAWAARADFEARKRLGTVMPNVTVPLHLTPLDDRIKLEVTTLNGDVEVYPGEWVICGVRGEFYPCSDEIFKETYEEAE